MLEFIKIVFNYKETLQTFVWHKNESFFKSLKSFFNYDHVTCLDIDSVKLIKTGPSPRTGQAFEELAHGHKVQLVAAVEHNGLNSQSFAQILGSLSFTSPSRTSGRPTKFQMESPRQGEVTSAS